MEFLTIWLSKGLMKSETLPSSSAPLSAPTVLVQRELDKSVSQFWDFCCFRQIRKLLSADYFYQVFLGISKLWIVPVHKMGWQMLNCYPNDNSSPWTSYPWQVVPLQSLLAFDQLRCLRKIVTFSSAENFLRFIFIAFPSKIIEINKISGNVQFRLKQYNTRNLMFFLMVQLPKSW